MQIDKQLVKAITRTSLPVTTSTKKEAAAALLDDQKPYELFEKAAFADACVCINLYRAIGEKRPDKESENITLGTLANIYGVNALRTKLVKFREFEKSALAPEDRDLYMQNTLRSNHLARQVLKLSTLIGYTYPKQLALAGLLFSCGELHYSAANITGKRYTLTLKEKMALNHAIAVQFNLPLMVKQSTGQASARSYQSELIYWSYRYLLALEQNAFADEKQAQNHLADILCISAEKMHSHLTQLAIQVAKEGVMLKKYQHARYILLQHYENKCNAKNNTSLTVSSNTQARKFIDMLYRSQDKFAHLSRNKVVRYICSFIDKTQPADIVLIIAYAHATRLSSVVWSSRSGQVNMQELLQPNKIKDNLIDVLARTGKTMNLITEQENTTSLTTLYQTCYLNKLAAKHICISPLFYQCNKQKTKTQTYLLCVANYHSILDQDQLHISKALRHYFHHHAAHKITNSDNLPLKHTTTLLRQ